jgi:hypothetical protein
VVRYGLDYSWHGPLNPGVWKRDGYTFVCRYVSPNASKNLTVAEAKLLADYGLDIVLVWESTATRALEGYNAGRSDAAAAFKQAAALGMPSGRPIYFAVDTDTSYDRVTAYFRGVRSLRRLTEVGVYGGIRVIEGLVGTDNAAWFWQTRAWSGGRWSPFAHLQQFSFGYDGGGLYSADSNRSYVADFGQWRYRALGAGAGVSIPAPPQEAVSWDYSAKVAQFATELIARNDDLSYYSRKIQELIQG